MSDSWKLTLPCTRAEAEAIDAGDDLGIAPPPVLMTCEITADDPDDWQLEAYFDGKPSAAAVKAVRALAPSSARRRARPERIPDQDWVTLSQAGLAPVRAGRFFVHTAASDATIPPGLHPFQIEASQAFGTGHHQTTSGCLMMLDSLKRGGLQVRNLIDIGTGTGLLGFAALHLWPHAYATGSDIDPASIAVTRENAAINGVTIGDQRGQMALATAPGLQHPLLIARAPYDLIIANILAGPLIALAPSIAMALAPGGTLVLAGLLTTQAPSVLAAYRRQGLLPLGRITIGDWPTLRLRKRRRYGQDRATRHAPPTPEAPNFGSW
ncbi:50S ribosomal protein L11 methyltransferase [Sphingomonas sp. 28-63-12]|uniref:50S ribosomal protein L11 methyltransferase n=1 Tax=Sphingomonas sp. 28-63-12 TaxID=1970434 RepID=UPI000BD7D969|nr:MAG: ribonucleotide-diphosphate reductase subunit beta [Sphingomonas sp. 28-63-12]